MKKNWLLAVGLVLILASGGLIGCEEGSAAVGEITELNLSSQQQGIWVTGQGKVTTDPDIATLRLGIEAEQASVAEAQAQAAEAMDEVMTALTRNGVAKKDIQTQQFSIRRITKWDRTKEEEVVVGYRVINMVTAKIRNIEKTGAIIDAVAQAGGDLTRVDSINFSVEDPTDYYEEAREEAIADAKAKARQLANLAGVTLGKPTYISESFYAPPMAPRAVYEMEEAVVAKTAISPGELEINLNLQVAYAIK
ncbi:SIMPL domain-containing protein [Chloroflexota bacterium]